MKRILFCLLVILMASGFVSAQLENYAGFPENTGAPVRANIVVTSLTNSLQQDIVVLPDNRQVFVFNPDGTLKWQKAPGSISFDYGRTPVVTNITGDSNLEIIAYGNPGVHYAHLYIWGSDGIILKDITVGMNMILTPPLVADIGEKIIITGAGPGYPDPGVTARGFYAYNSSGTRLWHFPDIGPAVRIVHNTVGDIDGDNRDEAAVIVKVDNTAFKLVILDLETTGASVLWEKNIGALISGAVIEDMNNDGKNDVIIGSGKGVYVWDGDGNLLWSNPVPVVTNSPPAIGDIDGDGIKDVVIGTDQQKQVFAISEGVMMPGFPVYTRQSVWSRPALFDFNGDGKLEIIAGDFSGFVYGWDHTGAVLKYFPFKPSTSGFMSNPVIADLQGNGTYQIVMGSDDGNVYVWPYDYSDNTPPVTTDDVDGLWHNTDVLVTLSAVDEGSGVDATYYSIDETEPSSSGNTIAISSEGIFTIKYFSTDKAGNTEPVKTAINTVKIDKTVPVTVDDSDNIWHNTDVTLTLSATDTLSGVDSVHYTIDGSSEVISESPEVPITFTDEGIHTVTYYSVDNAGNVEPVKTAEVKIDKTIPVTTDNSDGIWHNSDVTLNLSVSDAVSGLDSLHYTVDGSPGIISDVPEVSITFTDNGIHEVTYYSVDNAGNVEPVRTAEVKIDTIPPVTTDDSDGLWHNGNVVVTLNSTDNLAGVYGTYYTVIPEPETILDSLISWFNEIIFTANDEQNGNRILLEDEGIYSIKYYSVDNALNPEAEKTSGQVKIDKTLPEVTVNVPQAITYLHSDIIILDFSAVDSLSGIKTMDASIDNLTVFDGDEFDMLELEAGTHSFGIIALDNAGNPGNKVASFNVVIDIDSLIALTERGAGNGWINDTKISEALLTNLKMAKGRIDKGQVKSAINILYGYIEIIDSQTGKTISTEGADILESEAIQVIDGLSGSVEIKGNGNNGNPRFKSG